MPQDLERIVIGVAVDRAKILDRVKVRAPHFLEKERIKCVIAISERIRQGVRNVYRKLVKCRYGDEGYYGRMYKLGRCKVYEDIRPCEGFGA